MIFTGKGPLRGEITVPGDKSISHRSIMLGAIAKGDTCIRGFLESADCLSTIAAFRAMGISIEKPDTQTAETKEIIVHGKGLHGLQQPEKTIDAGNSGTTTRLISGILAGQKFASVIDGDVSLRSRPMNRIIRPLTMMGAKISGEEKTQTLPLRIFPAPNGLSGIDYVSEVPSAQVKSCILLAGLYAQNGPTSVTEAVLSRDHTERMLSGFGAKISRNGTSCRIDPGTELTGQEITIPGDISSAAYFIAAGLTTPGSEILIKNVGINPTRSGILEAAHAMGADISVARTYDAGGEPAADLLVRHSKLPGTVIEGDLIPTLIDELPVIAVMAAFAKGTTVIRDAAELRVKESDRIAAMTENLLRMGCSVTSLADGMVIEGGADLHDAVIDCHMDHRIAMSFAVAAAASGTTVELQGGECVNISYPGFFCDLNNLF